jgi:hypothetical protein
MDEELKFHKKFAVDLFNYTWELLENPRRTQEEDDTMLNAAHASRFHWEKAGEPVNLARGEWQISRVYCTLKRSEPALYHAERCLKICEENGIGDFDLAYAYEALARALMSAGDREGSQRYRRLALEAGQAIIEEEDREIFMKDLGTITG